MLEKYYEDFLEKNPFPRQLKSLETLQGFSAMYRLHHGKKVINFSTSDYLGLSNHPLLIERSQEFAETYGVGAQASRLVTGNLGVYASLEEKLAKALGKPAALILGAGYQTNISVLEALLDKTVLGHEPIVFCDRLCHASLLASSRFVKRLYRFKHNDLNHLRLLLEKFSDVKHPKFILAESIYSMEGDVADLAGLIELAREFQAFLYIDDAHGVGVYGDHGFGKTPEFADQIPLIMGTFSKGLGSFGSYIGCSATLRDYLINKCKGLIYSTGLPPVVLGAISAAIDLVPELGNARKKVLQHAERVRTVFRQEQINVGYSSTQIIPWIIGDAKLTRKIAELLENQSILASAIQPPSVPMHTSRIRFCLSANHSSQDVEKLLDAVITIKSKLLTANR